MPIPAGPATTNAVSSTAGDIIKSALRLINVLAASESPSLDESNDALGAFNNMLDSWNADRLAIFTTASTDFALSAGKQAYTLGSGADFDMTRPARIDSMSAILLANPSNPIEEPIRILTVDEWQTQYPVKTVNGSFPLVCYDDGGFPNRMLSFWPIPTDSINKVRIYSWQPLTLAAALNTTVTFPPGYAEAFRYNLALRLAPEYGSPISPLVQQIAAESLAKVKTMNAPDLKLQSDLLASPDGYNWKADMFGIPY